MRSSFRRTTSLTDDEVRALWRFRLTLVDLKPTVSQEQDYASFSKDLRWPGWVWILRDEGEVAGFFLQRGVPLEWDGRALLCLLPEYGFLAPHLRGHPVLPLASAAITVLSLGAHPLRPKYVAASTYPPGYIAFRRVIEPFWTLHDPTLPAWEKGLLQHLASRVSASSYDPETGVVTMRTIPRVDREPAAPDSRALWDDYARANPRWREGYGLFFMFPLDAGLLARVALHGLQRAVVGRRQPR